VPHEIQQLYAYNRWANRRILAAVGALSAEERGRDLGSSFPSVQATLAHVLLAEWIWLERWNGRSPTGLPGEWDLSEWPGLENRWNEVEAAQARFVAALAEADLERAVDYRTTDGTPYAAPLGQLLRHVVNHSTYHRGQVVTMLRQLGAAAPSTDLVLYHREQKAE
jgi:uncharacterized damage-inducible protein DinB